MLRDLDIDLWLSGTSEQVRRACLDAEELEAWPQDELLKPELEELSVAMEQNLADGIHEFDPEYMLEAVARLKFSRSFKLLDAIVEHRPQLLSEMIDRDLLLNASDPETCKTCQQTVFSRLLYVTRVRCITQIFAKERTELVHKILMENK